MKNHAIVSLFLLLLLTGIHANAQNTQIKVYTSYALQPQYTFDNILNQPAITKVYNATPMIGLALARERANGTVWELAGHFTGGFGNVLSTPDSIFEFNNEFQSALAQLQLTRSRPLCSEFNSRMHPYFGWFARTTGQWAEYVPGSSQTFPISNREVYAQIGCEPRLEFVFGKRFRLDLNASIGLGRMGLENTLYEDPTLTPEQQKSTTFDFDISPDLQIRMGLVWQLSNK